MQSMIATGADDATRGFFSAVSSTDKASEVAAVVVALNTCQHVPAIGEMEREELKIERRSQREKKIA